LQHSDSLVASETSAIHTAALFKTLSPEAQARANEALDRAFAEVNTKGKRR
jgi:hypothetical protein